jgi:hypothetical protein
MRPGRVSTHQVNTGLTGLIFNHESGWSLGMAWPEWVSPIGVFAVIKKKRAHLSRFDPALKRDPLAQYSGPFWILWKIRKNVDLSGVWIRTFYVHKVPSFKPFSYAWFYFFLLKFYSTYDLHYSILKLWVKCILAPWGLQTLFFAHSVLLFIIGGTCAMRKDANDISVYFSIQN